MAIYTVCLGIALAVEASNKEDGIEKARAELQGYLDGSDGSEKMIAKDFDLYHVSELNMKGIV